MFLFEELARTVRNLKRNRYTVERLGGKKRRKRKEELAHTVAQKVLRKRTANLQFVARVANIESYRAPFGAVVHNCRVSPVSFARGLLLIVVLRPDVAIVTFLIGC